MPASDVICRLQAIFLIFLAALICWLYIMSMMKCCIPKRLDRRATGCDLVPCTNRQSPLL
ncbi:MAG: hypothetical protein V6Z81_10580 [Parvularculales bacterium]